MDQSAEIYFCIEEDCTDQNRVIQSLEHYNKSHNGHKCRAVSELRVELSDDSHILKNMKSKGDSQRQFDYIDDQAKKLTENFQVVVQDLVQRLKQHVYENLISVNSEKLLLAILNNDKDSITTLQASLPFLNKGKAYFESLADYSRQVEQNLESLVKNVNEKVDLIKSVKLENFSSFIWSEIVNKELSQITGKLITSQTNQEENIVLIQPKLSFLKNSKVQIKITKLVSYAWLQISDLDVFRKTCPSLKDNQAEGLGAYSHANNGIIYTTDQGNFNGFSFAEGDIIELQWDGPTKTFTLLKVSTQEKYEFKTTYKTDANIYFSVTLFDKSSMEIVD